MNTLLIVLFAVVLVPLALKALGGPLIARWVDWRNRERVLMGTRPDTSHVTPGWVDWEWVSGPWEVIAAAAARRSLLGGVVEVYVMSARGQYAWTWKDGEVLNRTVKGLGQWGGK
ncbi:hypothetical protein [Sinosporangium siamense]|uniref:Uncharacterized protein n=1 Tax=Sinosporangium siamense TaxID=1367973 RepID=A0A919RP40_9ACTN|nr:hypothetical protein [Sinosporangium siamense]GII97326.1 hypothetical protein Ssi02_75570 [Sinosporangium siamense]